jgi:protein-disulfide isomerase
MDLPLEAIHKQAFKAAEATHCAADQGKYWEMHDRLFANQKTLEPFAGHAGAIGLDLVPFNKCLEDGTYTKKVRKSMAEANKVTTGTPAFVIGATDPNDPKKVTGISFIRGAQPFGAFESNIDTALSQAK